jgi:hypothetical protein
LVQSKPIIVNIRKDCTKLRDGAACLIAYHTF